MGSILRTARGRLPRVNDEDSARPAQKAQDPGERRIERAHHDHQRRIPATPSRHEPAAGWRAHYCAYNAASRLIRSIVPSSRMLRMAASMAGSFETCGDSLLICNLNSSVSIVSGSMMT